MRDRWVCRVWLGRWRWHKWRWGWSDERNGAWPRRLAVFRRLDVVGRGTLGLGSVSTRGLSAGGVAAGEGTLEAGSSPLLAARGGVLLAVPASLTSPEHGAGADLEHGSRLVHVPGGVRAGCGGVFGPGRPPLVLEGGRAVRHVSGGRGDGSELLLGRELENLEGDIGTFQSEL